MSDVSHNDTQDVFELNVWRIPVALDRSVLGKIKRFFGYNRSSDVILNNVLVANELFKQDPEKYRKLLAQAN